MVKRFAPLVLAALALSAPAALAAGPRDPGSAGKAATARAAGPQLRLHALRRELAHLRRCTLPLQPQPAGGADESTPPAARARRCQLLAARLLQQLQKLDQALQARIAKLQSTCGGGPTGAPTSGSDAAPGRDPCRNADRRIARLQALDQTVQGLIAKLQQPSAAPASTATG